MTLRSTGFILKSAVANMPTESNRDHRVLGAPLASILEFCSGQHNEKDNRAAIEGVSIRVDGPIAASVDPLVMHGFGGGKQVGTGNH